MTLAAAGMKAMWVGFARRLSRDAFEESLPTTPYSGRAPQDCSQLYLKLTAVQRQLIKARERLQAKDASLTELQVEPQVSFGTIVLHEQIGRSILLYTLILLLLPCCTCS